MSSERACSPAASGESISVSSDTGWKRTGSVPRPAGTRALACDQPEGSRNDGLISKVRGSLPFG
jgi:hypothetical protein